MKWPTDERTARAAVRYPILIGAATPAQQFSGRWATTNVWNKRVIQPATWKEDRLWACPEEIMRHFRNGHYTEAVALVAVWGRMWRHPDAIWGPRKLETIERILADCAQSILESQSIEDSWRMLTGRVGDELGWTAVMTSKNLTFLCRSLGFTQDPPVPIDEQWIRKRIWRTFRDAIPVSERPANWDGNSFQAYCRYMTAIRTWADQKHWTTVQVEATIMDQFEGGERTQCTLRTGSNSVSAGCLLGES